jgi:hypothetical protein
MKPRSPRIAAAARPPTAMPAMAPVESPPPPLAARVAPALSAAPPALAIELDEVDNKLLGVEVGVIVEKAVTTTTLSSEGGLGGDGRVGRPGREEVEIELVEVDVEVDEVDVESEVEVDVDVDVEVEVVGGRDVLNDME